LDALTGRGGDAAEFAAPLADLADLPEVAG